MKSLDILNDLYYLGILAASLNVRAHSHKRVRQRRGVGGEYTETDGTRITQRKIHSRQNRRAPQSQGGRRGDGIEDNSAHASKRSDELLWRVKRERGEVQGAGELNWMG
jgi:hypothetical protein